VLNGSRLDGLCPACTWGSLLEVEGEEFEPPAPSGPSKGLFQFPGHVVCEEIARGGMGIVYRARQAEPAREVALKMLLPHQLGSAEMRERFRLEVRAIAGLEHPAILPVYQVGEHDGLPYFTMKLATGGTLASRAQRYRGKFRQIAELMVTLVEAVHFAHERGVLHRDLKPGNILFDEADRPYVSDFGLAKFTELASGDTPTLTRSIQLLGTPQFLPPEIAGGSVSSATTAGDIYSLGAVLYELLTGAPPFVGENLTTLLKAIVEHEPVRPSKLIPGLPRDLEVICLECLAKEPSRRYASARELAEDLRRWRAGRTILARPATRFERARAWSRRNPALAIVGTALMLALAGGVILQSVNNRRLQFALAESLLAQARLERSSGRAGQRFGTLSLVARAAKNVRSLWGEAPAVTVTALRSEVAAALALPDVRALARWPVHIAHFENEFDFTANLDRYVTAALDGGFTLFSTADQRLLWHVTGVATNSAVELRISSDGRWAAANYQDGHVELHSRSTRQPPRRWPGERNALTHFAFAPSGDCFAVATPNSDGAQSVEVLQLQTGVIHARLTGGPAMAMAFDRTGAHLATAGTDLVVWRLADAHKLWSAPLPHSASAVAWSPDGHGLAVALDRRLGEATLAFKGEPVLLFDALNGRQQTVLAEAATRVERLAFHPDGDSLVAATWHGELLWVSVRTDGFRLTAPGAQRALRFAPGGEQLAYAPSKDELGLLEVATPSALHEWRSSSPPAQESFTMAVSTNGRWVLTGTDNAVQLWDADARAEVASLPLPAKAWWVQVLFGPGDEFFYYSGASFGVRRVELARTNGPEVRFRLQFGRAQFLDV